MGNDRWDDPSTWLQDSRSRILNLLLGITMVLGALGVAFNVVASFLSGAFSFDTYYYFAGLAVAVFLFFSRRITDRVRASLFLAALFGFAVFAFHSGWLAGGARTFLIAAVVCAAVLIGPRAGLFMAGLGILTYIVFAIGFGDGWLILRRLPDPVTPPPMVIEGIGFSIAVGITVVSLWFLRQALDAVIATSRDARRSRELMADSAQQLDQANRALSERTRVLETFNQALENQIWRTNGQIRLDEVLREQQTIAQLAERVIGQLCKYLDAQVGALFLLEDDSLQLLGRYAYPADASLPERYRPGEGLVGQALVERQMIVVDDLVDENFKVSSALGEARPRGLVAVPFLFQDRVVGAIEMGALHGFGPREIFFLNSVMPGIAVTFQTALANARINALLDESRKQADTLQAQEEELRAANEELQAQADALREAGRRTRRGGGGR